MIIKQVSNGHILEFHDDNDASETNTVVVEYDELASEAVNARKLLYAIAEECGVPLNDNAEHIRIQVINHEGEALT